MECGETKLLCLVSGIWWGAEVRRTRLHQNLSLPLMEVDHSKLFHQFRLTLTLDAGVRNLTSNQQAVSVMSVEVRLEQADHDKRLRPQPRPSAMTVFP